MSPASCSSSSDLSPLSSTVSHSFLATSIDPSASLFSHLKPQNRQYINLIFHFQCVSYLSRILYYVSLFGSFSFVPPPHLSGRILFAPPDARAIFLHKDLLCNETCSVIGGCITHWGGGGCYFLVVIQGSYMMSYKSFAISQYDPCMIARKSSMILYDYREIYDPCTTIRISQKVKTIMTTFMNSGKSFMTNV